MTPWPDSVDPAGSAMPVKALFLSFAIFLYGFFLFPDAPLHYDYYYIAVLIPSVFVLKPFFQMASRNSLFVLITVFSLYMALSGLWSRPFEIGQYLEGLLAVLSVQVFVTLLIGFSVSYPEYFDRLFQGLCVVGAVVALASMLVFYSTHAFPSARVNSIGRISSINRGAAVYGALAIMSAGYYFASRDWKRYLFAALLCVLSAFVLLARSRTAIIATSVALVVYLLSRMGKETNYLIIALAVLAATAILVYPELLQSIVRDDPYRPYIWDTVLSQVKDAPMFGIGILSDTSIPANPALFPTGWNHAHSAYLAAFRDGGAVGLIMLLAVLARAFAGGLKLFRHMADPRCLALVVFAVTVIAAIQDRLLTKPREAWLYFWVPVAFVIVYELRQVGKADAGPK